jgi:hypothetical protein
MAGVEGNSFKLSDFKKYHPSFEGSISPSDFKAVSPSLVITFSEQKLDLTTDFYNNTFTSKAN